MPSETEVPGIALLEIKKASAFDLNETLSPKACNNTQIAGTDDRGIEVGIAGIDVKNLGAGELGGRGGDNDAVDAYLANDLGAELPIASSEDETLCADRADDQGAILVLGEQIKDLPFVQILADQPSGIHSIDAEKRAF